MLDGGGCAGASGVVMMAVGRWCGDGMVDGAVCGSVVWY